MHPAFLRIRNRAAREVLPRPLRPDVRDDLVRLGSDYGTWWVPIADLRHVMLDAGAASLGL